MQDSSATFETTNWCLENFLYWHKIKFQYCYKNPNDGSTVWVYRKTDEFDTVLSEFLSLYSNGRRSS